MRILAIFWFVFLSITSAQASSLINLNNSDNSNAVVLVGGFSDDFGYFKPWMSELENSSLAIYGFAHNHRAAPMEVGAQDLANELKRLSGNGVRSVTILAHSMGGLMTKRALHLLGEEGTSRFISVEFRAYGTPWGGFFAANFARWVPGGQLVGSWLGFPMGAEIGSRSDFMLSLREKLPANVNFVIYESIDDDVSRPKSDSAVEQYASVLVLANSVHRLSHVDHTGFVTALAFAQ